MYQDRAMTFKTTNLANRVWPKILKGAPDDCWPWTGSVFTRSGYGRITLPNGRGTTVHRAVWILLFGEPHASLEICHICDNRICCNPSHLFAGTAKTNALDKVMKGRQARNPGTRNGSCKLTEVDVTQIRASPFGHRAIARQYGISESDVRMIRSKETWRHV